MPIAKYIRYMRLWPPWGLELRSESCMFDIVSNISNVLRRRCLWRAVMRTSIILDWGVILYAKNIFIVSQFYPYKFDVVNTGYPIDTLKFIIQF